MRSTSRASAARSATRELGRMPFAVPSQRGFTKSGNGAGQRAARAARPPTPIDACGGTGRRPRRRRQRPGLVERERERERIGAERRHSEHLEQHGRPGLAVPRAAALGDVRGRVERRQLALPGAASSACGLPSRSGSWPSCRIAASSAAIVASGSYSASASAGAPVGAASCRAGRTRGRSGADASSESASVVTCAASRRALELLAVR